MDSTCGERAEGESNPFYLLWHPPDEMSMRFGENEKALNLFRAFSGRLILDRSLTKNIYDKNGVRNTPNQIIQNVTER